MLAPMAKAASDPLGSMGNDAPLAHMRWVTPPPPHPPPTPHPNPNPNPTPHHPIPTPLPPQPRHASVCPADLPSKKPAASMPQLHSLPRASQCLQPAVGSGPRCLFATALALLSGRLKHECVCSRLSHSCLRSSHPLSLQPAAQADVRVLQAAVRAGVLAPVCMTCCKLV